MRRRMYVFFLMIRRPPRSTLDRSSAASDVYKRQEQELYRMGVPPEMRVHFLAVDDAVAALPEFQADELSLIHISEPTRPY